MSDENATARRMQRLFDLWGKFDRVYFRILQKWNLSYNTYLVLEELLTRPEGWEPAALADRLSIPRQTMTFLLDSLEREGRLDRMAHPADRRRKLAALTAAGREFATNVSVEVSRREYEAMRTLSESEQEELLALYDRLRIGFEESFRD